MLVEQRPSDGGWGGELMKESWYMEGGQTKGKGKNMREDKGQEILSERTGAPDRAGEGRVPTPRALFPPSRPEAERPVVPPDVSVS